MMARRHILLGSAMTAAAASALALVSNPNWGAGLALRSLAPWVQEPVSGLAQGVQEWFVPWELGSLQGACWMLLSLVLLWLGFLLPDLDSSTSRLGRHVPTPGPHRGWLHSDWPVYLLVLVSIWEPLRPLLWLAVGYWTHLELDGLSRAGRVRWYPLGRGWRVTNFRGERMVVRTGWRGLYRAGHRSESLTTALILVICCGFVALFIISWLYQGHPEWFPGFASQ